MTRRKVFTETSKTWTLLSLIVAVVACWRLRAATYRHPSRIEVMKMVTKLAMVGIFLSGCGGSGIPSSSSSPPPMTIPPNAFSDASISGAYSFGVAGGPLAGNIPSEEVSGAFTADGKGNIVSGQDTDTDEYYSIDGNSYFTIMGNYKVNQDGTGTIQLLLTCSFSLTGKEGRCSVGTQFTVISSITVAENGNFTFSMLPYQGSTTLTVTAEK